MKLLTMYPFCYICSDIKQTMERSSNKKWYAVYTAPRAEKKVAERFTEASIEYYLPLKTVRRQWSDRIKKVEVPVINGYIFVRITPKQVQEVLQVFGAISFVRMNRENNAPAAIPDEQIRQLRFMCDYSDESVDISMENIKPGEKVIVVKGNMTGLMGELVRIDGKHKVLIRIDHLGCATTSISLSFLQRG